MLHQIVGGLKNALGLNRPGRNMAVFPDDVFVVSYPKSGNTWTRFLIANLVHPNERANFANINRLVPDPEALSRRELDRLPHPRYIKSHQYFDPRYPKVIYVVRDPRDVALSHYHFQRKRKVLADSDRIEPFVSRFVAGGTSSYGSWGENVAGWLATRNGSAGFLLVRYEDMLAKPNDELARVASFLSIAAHAAQIHQAVQRSSADEMRSMERNQAHLWSTTKDTRQDIPFVREAKAGGWKSELPQISIDEIESKWGGLMRYLGYETKGSGSGHDAVFESVLTGLGR